YGAEPVSCSRFPVRLVVGFLLMVDLAPCVVPAQWLSMGLFHPGLTGGSAGQPGGFRYLSVAFRVISETVARAFDNGQSRFAAAAIAWNFASSMPGTVACSVSAMRSMTKPSPCLDRRTLALVSTSVVASPALSQANEHAIVKQAAWAAPRISSGLVPRRSSSKRLAKPDGGCSAAPGFAPRF